MATKTRDEDTPFGRKTYFGERALLHPNIPAHSTSITLMRNEEMRYGIQIQRSDWSTFFSAREIQTITEFEEKHRAWLEWGRKHNAGGNDLLSHGPLLESLSFIHN